MVIDRKHFLADNLCNWQVNSNLFVCFRGFRGNEFFFICTELALDHIYRQPAPGRFLILGLHICAGIPHGLDHLVE